MIVAVQRVCWHGFVLLLKAMAKEITSSLIKNWYPEAQYIPRNLANMRSERGYHEICKEVYVKAYCQEMSALRLKNGTAKYTREEIPACPPPQFWDFTKSPWYFGLLVKVFLRNPQLALDVSSVMKDPATNRPVLCAVMRRKEQQQRMNHPQQSQRQ